MHSPGLEAIAARVELPVMRRLLSQMEGRHGSMRAGRGMEFLDMADYKPGDDVKDIDWLVSARAGRPVVKRFEATANVQVILVVDIGRSMGALAPSGETKEEVALAACETIAWLSTVRGDQVGMVAGDSRRLRQVPARSGNSHAELILRKIAEDIDLASPSSDVARLLDRVLTSTRRRSLVVLVTDGTNPAPAHEDVVKRLRVRHEMIVMSVSDADPTSLPRGTDVIDVDAGPLPDFVTADAELAAQAREAIAQRKGQVSQMLWRRGVTQVGVDAVADVPRALVRALERGSRVR
ncbi:DUF58 domain-containing protein [Actinomyces provencensis]|uniref:DUF58 domain-containing protein n=1 Tax=Actinomyces provencensis TaxID=1720198 RepID=UPI00096A665B|nr:DUF58 domain-containing protein [Actinomyces provencensis]